MRFEEVIPALRKGYKIRRKGTELKLHLRRGDFPLVDEEDNTVDLSDGCISDSIFHCDDWEIIEYNQRPYEVGDVVKNVHGASVRIICIDRKTSPVPHEGKTFPVIGLLTVSDKAEHIICYTLEGKALPKSDGDLEPVYEEEV